MEDEEISNIFSIDDITMVKIRQFMKNYRKNNINESINDLINIHSSPN